MLFDVTFYFYILSSPKIPNIKWFVGLWPLQKSDFMQLGALSDGPLNFRRLLERQKMEVIEEMLSFELTRNDPRVFIVCGW